MPTISVLMAEHNTNPEYLKEAINSVLKQTYNDFEFIIVDDNTSKENKDLLMRYQKEDGRIIIIHNKENYGLTRSLNIGLNYASGQYLARMDSDDICIESRLQKQIDYIKKHDDVLVLGGLSQIMNSRKIALKPIYDFDIIKVRMLFYNCALVHPTAFINLNRLRNLGLKYNEEIKKSQDYMLWSDCLLHGKIDVLPEIVLKTRIHSGQITQTSKGEQHNYSMQVQNKLMKQYFGVSMNKEQAELHYQIIFGKYNCITEVEKHFYWLMLLNQEQKTFDTCMFKKECYYMWFIMAIKSILHQKNFSCLKSKLTWKVFFSIFYWPYYFKYI